MNKLDDELVNLKRLIYDNEFVKEYLKLKEEISSNSDILFLHEEIVKHQKLMSLNMNNDEIYQKEKNLYDASLLKYNSHPLIQNYNQVQDYVYNLLDELKSIIL